MGFSRQEYWSGVPLPSLRGNMLLLLLCCFSCVDSAWLHRQQPTRLPRPWESPGMNTGMGCHFLLQCMTMKSKSEVAQSCPTLATPWTAAYQAPASMGFSRQDYWSGVPSPSLDKPTANIIFKGEKLKTKVSVIVLLLIEVVCLASYIFHETKGTSELENRTLMTFDMVIKILRQRIV